MVSSKKTTNRATALACGVAAAFIFICFLNTPIAEAQEEQMRKVLVLNSYHRGYDWSDHIVEAIRAEFDKADLEVELFFEYMDTMRYEFDEAFGYMKQLCEAKYTKAELDLIITTDDGALYFVLIHRDHLFLGVPVVFCGVQEAENSTPQNYDSVTGILEQYDYQATARIALKLHPSAKRILAITDKDKAGLLREMALDEVLNNIDRKVEVDVLSLGGHSMSELLEKIEQLGSESILFLVSAFRDKDGVVYTREESAQMIRHRCKAPIYVTVFDWLGLGPVGGRVAYATFQGQAAAEMAMRILKGERAENIPILTESPNAYMFDYLELKRFGISVSRLPAGSIIINEPQSFYYQYKIPIWIVTGIITLLAIMVIILSANILWRKKAQKALRASEHKYRSLSNNIPGMVYRGRPDWSAGIISGSQAICGYTVEDFNAQAVTWLDIIYLEDRARVLQEATILEEKVKTIIQEYRIIAKDGSIRWVEDHKTSVFGKSGFKGVDGIAYDITERKRAEKILQASEQKFKDLVEITTDWVWEVDKDGVYIYASPKVKELLGYEVGEILGKTPFDFMPEEEAERTGKFFKEKAVKSEPLYRLENINRHKDGHLVVLETNGIPIFDEEGRLKGYRGIDRDITERKRAEQELRKARDELEIRVEQRTADLAKANIELRSEVNERKKAKERLLIYQKKLRSMASELSLGEERLKRRLAIGVHDHIGQKLAISKIKIESLRKSVSSSKLAKMLEETHDLVAQAIKSTRSLTFELSPPVLYELGFEAAMKWLVRQTRERHGLSTKFIDDGQPKPLDNDVRVLLFQAVRELLVNVAKHAQAHNVEVSARRVGSEIQVRVEDDGVGFDISRTSNQGYTRDEFGLFSIRERLSHIGGYLNVESEPGQGACVTLVAPINHKGKDSKGKQT
ncbi:MAG: sensor histidine kinase [Planctomycetota bacterium]|jgi:PAS domain S-box-containing protein